jgi:xylan 1,4-beta-xylosidase
VKVRRVGFRNNDAYTAYLEMGRPETLTAEQIAALNALSDDEPVIQTVQIGADGRGALTLPMLEGDLVLAEVVVR